MLNLWYHLAHLFLHHILNSSDLFNFRWWYCRSMRFVIKDTIEERILQFQEKKQLMFEG
jgi:hypothetical protein